jgi:hypothetical protein
MIAQKESVVPTVNTVPVTNYSAASNFTTDYIEFPESMKDWSVQTTFSGGAVAGALLTILVSNTYNGSYVPYSPTVKDLDLTAESNLIVYDEIMPVRYMKLQYVAGTTTGQISFTITK